MIQHYFVIVKGRCEGGKEDREGGADGGTGGKTVHSRVEERGGSWKGGGGRREMLG